MSGQFQSTGYGARILDGYQGVKQFFSDVPSGTVTWVYKSESNIPGNPKVITPFTNNLAIKTSLFINGDITLGQGGSIITTSDERVKTNIYDITETETNNILDLCPKSYTYIDDKDGKKHYGVLAQDTEAIFPELVNTDEYGMKSVNYLEFIPLLLNKMREMQKEIDELKGIKADL